MRVLIVVLLISVFLPNGIAQAQSPAISSGDTLSYELLAPTQQPGQTIVFEKKPDRILKVTISDNGDRSYDHRSGKNFAVRDAFATKIVSHGNPIDEAYQFRHFPLGKTPEPGQQWDVSFRRKTDSYGDNIVSYHAIAQPGPDFPILIDNREARIPTVRVDYEGVIKSTKHTWNATATITLYYAPSLGEIVFNEATSLEKGFLMSGYRETLKSIKTANRTDSRKISTE